MTFFTENFCYKLKKYLYYQSSKLLVTRNNSLFSIRAKFIQYFLVSDPGWVEKAMDSSIVRTKGVASCTPSPCLDGGTCITRGNSHSCVCAPGFTGVFCQVSFN